VSIVCSHPTALRRTVPEGLVLIIEMPFVLVSVSRTALISLAILLVEHCSTVTLTRYTQQRTNVIVASPPVAVLVTELIKFAMSITLEMTQLGGLGGASTPAKLWATVVGRPRDTARLSVPGLLYTVQNNLIFVALGHLEIVTFQVLYQAKLVITAVLLVLCLGQRFSARQWLALVMLMIGVVLVELSSATGAKSGSRHRHSQLRLGIGAAAALGSAALSSLAGVYFETVVKRKEAHAVTLWARNVQLGLFAIPLACLGVATQGRAVWTRGLLTGFDGFVWALVVLNASGGLVVAAVIKYGDNILKNFSTASAVVVGSLISFSLFDFQPNIQFVFGATLVASASVLYAFGADMPAPPPRASMQDTKLLDDFSNCDENEDQAEISSARKDGSPA